MSAVFDRIAYTAGMRTRGPDPSTTVKKGFRPDIQGLRAVAVLAVIADHLFGYPLGGFVGVDVFFVISGFLITGLLLREHTKTGRISFVDFYKRRVRRIMPLAVLVLAVTVAASWVVFATGRAKSVTEDGIWAFLFAGNWRFAAAGTDYMNSDGPVSPLQHYWSLAVEEQFYVVWPVLILLVLGVLAASRRVLGWVMAAFIVGSFAFALWETAVNPTVAYFSTFSRAWELAIGAILAVGAAALAKIPDAIRPALAYLGLFGIAASLFVVTPESAFPGPWAALPVLASALVIAAGTGGDQRFLAPLTNPISRYLGDISYSLYLWHFPLIIFMEALLPAEGPLYYVLVLAAIVLVSAASYHFIEDPIRKSSWLDPKAAPVRDKKRRRRANNHLALTGLAVLSVLTAVVVSAALMKASGSVAVAGASVATVPSPAASVSADTPVPAADAQAALTTQLNAALAADAWPELSPSIDQLGLESRVPEWVQDGCLSEDHGAADNPQENAAGCVYGDPAAPKTAVVLGDSVAISYVPAIRAALEPQGFKVIVYTMQQCPAISVTVNKADGSEHPECDPFRQWTFEQVKALQPQLTVMSHAVNTVDRLASGAKAHDAWAEMAAGSESTFATVAGATERLVVIDPPPPGKSLQECATRINSPSECVRTIPEQLTTLSRTVREAGETVSPTIAFVDSKPWFCGLGNRCPAFVGTTPMFADGSHMTAAYSSSLGPVVAEAILAK